MKKLLLLMLALVMLFSLCSCHEVPHTPDGGSTDNGEDEGAPSKPDIWDGQASSTFAEGDGTQNNPYRIKSACELAFLAKSVNMGESYAGKYLVLDCDIDLNHIEWQPIGNGVNNFSGTFDGNGYSISNLKITEGVRFEGGLSGPDRILTQYAAGLFGTALNPKITNLIIDGANITIQNQIDQDMAYVGGLVGIIKADAKSEISDITVLNLTVVSGSEQEVSNADSLSVGGVIGEIYANHNNSSVAISRLYTSINVSIVNSRCDDHYIGGILGYVRADNIFDLKDCASYLSVAMNKEYCYTQNDRIAAIGAIGVQYSTASLSNVFSKVTVDMVHSYSHGYSAYTANVIAAQVTMRMPDSYLFENLFGYIEQIDEATGERAVVKQLYDIPYPETYAETNCLGTEILPSNHGFDESVWNLDDLSRPKLK